MWTAAKRIKNGLMKIWLWDSNIRDSNIHISSEMDTLINSASICQSVNKTSLPTKKEFYSNLTMESIRDSNSKHAKRVWEEFGLQNLDQYLLADLFINFKNQCLDIYELDPAHFYSAFGLIWQAIWRKQKSNWND